MRCLVDANQRDERDSWSLLAKVSRRIRTDPAIDVEPAGSVPSEMRSRGPRDEYKAAADPLTPSEPATDDA
jgi:hypothetical protein